MKSILLFFIRRYNVVLHQSEALDLGLKQKDGEKYKFKEEGILPWVDKKDREYSVFNYD